MTTDNAALPALFPLTFLGDDRTIDLLRMSERMTTEPLRFETAQLAGYVEFFAQYEDGRCWIGGWISDNVPNEEGALLIERRKWPGTIHFARYDRDDVPAGASGFLGLLSSDWVPTPGMTDAFIALATSAPLFLRSVIPPHIVAVRDVAVLFEQMAMRQQGGHFEALRQLILAPNSWLPGSAAASGFPVHWGVDAVTLVPSFGCIIQGWALSPVKAVREFSLRIGELVLRSDPLGTHRHARPDLRQAFPQLAPILGDAGFVALFRHPEQMRWSGSSTLKLIYEDGTSTNHEIGQRDIVWAGRGLGEEELLRAYPAIEHELFFPDLANALLRRERPNRPRLRALTASHSLPRAILRVVGAGRSEAYRLFDEVMEHRVLMETHEYSIVFVGKEADRDSLLSLFAGFQRQFTQTACLFVMAEDPELEDPLPLLRILGCERFLLVGSRLRLPAAVCAAALQHLTGEALMPGTITGPALGPSRAVGLAWTTDGLASLGGLAAVDALESVMLGSAAHTDRPPPPSELQRRIAAWGAIAA